MIVTNNLQKTTQGRKQRVGRGNGSNRGKNSGAGNKGQTKRGHVRIGFEGGQKALIRRTPKFRGFKQHDFKNKASFSLSVLDTHLDNKAVVTLALLVEKGLISDFVKTVRILKPTTEVKKSFVFPEDDTIYLTKGAKENIK
jgi:large subunit ribosomal protein L15